MKPNTISNKHTHTQVTHNIQHNIHTHTHTHTHTHHTCTLPCNYLRGHDVYAGAGVHRWLQCKSEQVILYVCLNVTRGDVEHEGRLIKWDRSGVNAEGHHYDLEQARMYNELYVRVCVCQCETRHVHVPVKVSSHTHTHTHTHAHTHTHNLHLYCPRSGNRQRWKDRKNRSYL